VLPLVIFSHSLPKEWLSLLDDRVESLVLPENAPKIAASQVAYVDSAAGLFSLLTMKIQKDLLDRMPNLRVISNMAVGVDNIDIAECTKRGIPVGNTPGILTAATADLTMALVLAAGRNLMQASRDAIDGKWITWSPTGWLGVDLDGATLGIIGMGKIGRAVAERAAVFGLRIIYYDPSNPENIPASFESVVFDNLLRESDFISPHCPLTRSTRGMFDDPAFQKMKRSAILINTSRGPVVVTDALVRALGDNLIGGAALDVTDPEPLPPDHPLYQFRNCLIVPHIGSATLGTRMRMARMACENLLAGLNGRPLPNCVNPEVYKNR
jgi:glyoxylate reductase